MTLFTLSLPFARLFTILKGSSYKSVQSDWSGLTQEQMFVCEVLVSAELKPTSQMLNEH